MRAAAAIAAITASVNKHFDADVAAKFADTEADMLDALARQFLVDARDADHVDRIIERVAANTSDGTLDWLVDTVDCGWPWMYSRIRDLDNLARI